MKRKKLARMVVASALALSVAAGTLGFSKEEVRADSSAFSYDSASGMLSGEITTSGTDNITRLEFYFSNSYSYSDENVILIDKGSGSYVHLNADKVTTDGELSNDAEVAYGGTVPIDEYGMNCVIYYIITEGNMTWTVDVYRDSTLSECIVAESTVPATWQDTASAVITEPTGLDLYFVDTKTSIFTSLSQLGEVVKAQVQEVDTTTTEFQGETKVEDEQNPLKTLLLGLIGVVGVAIVVTGYFLKKEKKRKDTKRSEDYVRKQNEKVKKKKEMENDELKALVAQTEADYRDEPGVEGRAGGFAPEPSGTLPEQPPLAWTQNAGEPIPASVPPVGPQAAFAPQGMMPPSQTDMGKGVKMAQSAQELASNLSQGAQQIGYSIRQDSDLSRIPPQDFSQGYYPAQNPQQIPAGQTAPVMQAQARQMQNQLPYQPNEGQTPPKRIPAFARKA
jgi:hypothetical protein